MSARVPPLAEREKPGLSETLPFPRRLDTCQACGKSHDLFGDPIHLTRWMECDAWDEHQPIVVVLCDDCSTRLIKPHPRLYKPLQQHEPMPGAMPICTHCRWQSALRCLSSTAKINGGPGLTLTFPQPTSMHLCGTRNGRRTGWTEVHYTGPVSACSGREVLGLVRDEGGAA